MSLFDEFKKKVAEAQGPEKMRENADKVEAYATQLEDAFAAFLGALDSVEEYVDNVVTNLRESAAAIREKADENWNGHTDKVAKPSIVTLDDKIAFIQEQLSTIGITEGPWFNGSMKNHADIVDQTYTAFGGR